MTIAMRVCSVALMACGLVGGSAASEAARHHDETTVAATVGTDAVNINTASVKQLATLDGIGPKLAEKIVEYRDAHGPFKKPEEVRKVQGLGAGLWEKNRSRIVVK